MASARARRMLSGGQTCLFVCVESLRRGIDVRTSKAEKNRRATEQQFRGWIQGEVGEAGLVSAAGPDARKETP